MKTPELAELGIPRGRIMKIAVRAAAFAGKAGSSRNEVRASVRALVKDPAAFLSDPVFGDLAVALAEIGAARKSYEPRGKSAPCRQWGEGHDEKALIQMDNACRLPVSVAGALMADAHVGYGLPIGGVLATDNAVIPYAVGMDIACRMHLTVLNLDLSFLSEHQDRLIVALEQETRFGVGSEFKRRRQHAVMDDDWSVSRLTSRLKDKAWSQLGTSGSGNHFVEFGALIIEKGLRLPPGAYLALLSHSGSRGTGAEVATYYSRLASKQHPELPRELTHLAWLDFDSNDGQEYWAAMELMGRYAAANHSLIHRHILENLGVAPLLELENHHNFAWREMHQGRNLIVHRKGATPAGLNDYGIIPGSMAAPGFVIRGRGNPASLNSASHGAGRQMSRGEAKKKYSWKDLEYVLEKNQITLLSAGLDEAPMAYKSIETVMAAQEDLVEILARFEPKLVKMSGD